MQLLLCAMWLIFQAEQVENPVSQLMTVRFIICSASDRHCWLQTTPLAFMTTGKDDTNQRKQTKACPCAPVSCSFICNHLTKLSLTRIETHHKEQINTTEKKKKGEGRRGGEIVLFTAGPRAPFSPHERGASDEVLIACGHKWFLQTL